MSLATCVLLDERRGSSRRATADRLLLLGSLCATSQWYTSGSDERMRRAQEAALRHAARARAAAATRPPKIAELISTAVLRRHLETMLRLDIEYDFLPARERDSAPQVLGAAFEQLKKTGVLYFENEGKNKGCWVMTRPRRGRRLKATRTRRRKRTKTPRSLSAPMEPSLMSAKTSPITCGSLACWARTLATSRSSLIPITSAGSRRKRARSRIRTLAGRRRSTT
jgi:hypothetical protein